MASSSASSSYASVDVGMVYVDSSLEPRTEARKSISRSSREASSNPVERRLRDGLASYRETWGDLPQVEVPAGRTLKRGDTGERVRLLRQRLGLDAGDSFDRELAEAVRQYRRVHALGAAAEADTDTIASLNRGASHYERVILLNIERARALPANPGERFALVDAASARLWFYEDGEAVDTMRVIVGKPEAHTQTPMLAGLIRYAMVNPYWNIPPDLVRDKIAPGVLSEGRGYLKARGYEILSDWTEDARVLSPDEVDWEEVADGSIDLRVRQLPGPNNGMGEIKFMFPNRFGVYLHDTPDKALFEHDERRFSSGCVRLEDARRFARWLFGDMPRGSSDDREERVDLDTPVPVYITYLTASADSDGIAFRDDPYDRDAPLLAQMEHRGGGGSDLGAQR